MYGERNIEGFVKGTTTHVDCKEVFCYIEKGIKAGHCLMQARWFSDTESLIIWRLCDELTRVVLEDGDLHTFIKRAFECQWVAALPFKYEQMHVPPKSKLEVNVLSDLVDEVQATLDKEDCEPVDRCKVVEALRPFVKRKDYKYDY